MGNSATKEQRAAHAQGRGHPHRSGTPPGQSPESSSGQLPSDQAAQELYASRHGRGSRSELSTLLGLASSHDRESMTLEQRRESKQEREARKVERERAAREKERIRSMRDEHVDGGFLVTQGVYTGVEDYGKTIVRRLMIERRIAPFWRGLNDHSDSWTENQLVAAAKGLPIPAADEIPKQESPEPPPTTDPNKSLSEQHLQHLTVPMGSRSQSFNSDTSGNPSPVSPTFHLPAPLVAGSSVLRGRSKTLAALTTASRGGPPQQEIQPREVMLPNEPKINGQPLEAYLYKDAAECPICFLYYPPYLNRTRCCDQAICSECFVQIKRPDPHPPEHADPTAPPPPPPPPSENSDVDMEGLLVSEPASCPFCKQPEFGVTFDAPPFRRGLVYTTPVSQHSLHTERNFSSPMSSSSSLQSTGTGSLPVGTSGPGERQRAASLSANAPTVITTDRVRPDWATKLQSARAHTARRSAAATALHTAAYLMGGRNGSPDPRAFAGFGRRNVLRRGTGDGGPGSSSAAQQLNMLAMMSERYASAGGRAGGGGGNMGETSPTMAGPPREGSRRNRMDDLEEMMMMEAIRLSLAAEEERAKREEKEAKKEAKKKAKEEKKEEKKARKSGALSPGFNRSATNLSSASSASNLPNPPSADPSKGKAIERPPPEQRASDQGGLFQPLLSRSVPTESSIPPNPQAHLARSRAQLQPLANADHLPQQQQQQQPPASPSYGTSTFRPSHLRNLSNASSSSSSLADVIVQSSGRSSAEASPNMSGINISRGESATPTGGGAGLEPMFNFQSLAALIGREGERDGGDLNEKEEGGHEKAEEDGLGGEGAGRVRGRRDEAGMGESVGTTRPEVFHDALEGGEGTEHLMPGSSSRSESTDADAGGVERSGEHASAS